MKSKELPQEFLGIPFLTIADVNTRIINHWEKENVIIDNRKDGKGWRKYSITDVVWITIVEKLREFNFPLESIKLVKAELFNKNDKGSSVLEILLDNYLSNGHADRVNIYSEGKLIIEEKDNYLNVQKLNDSFISISFDQVIKKVMPNYLMPIIKHDSWNLSPMEVKLLKLIRSGIFKTIEIENKGKEIKQINAEEIINNQQTFIDLVKEHDYQDIITSIRNGKIANKKRIIKLRK